MEDLIGNKQLHLDINSQLNQIHPIAHALSSKLRLEIICLLGDRSMNLNEIASALHVPLSTISLNISVLEKVGIVSSEAQAGVHGIMKLCSRMTDMITINLVATQIRMQHTGEIHMPVGCYADTQDVKPTCGLANAEGFIGVPDNPLAFYLPGHFGAQLIWMKQGLLRYQFPTLPFLGLELESIEISFEACSEAVNYRLEWPSDISLFINGLRIGSWLSPGDFGGRRGIQNPDWWPDSSTQYGQLITWRIDEEGSFLNHVRVSEIRLTELKLYESDHFTLCVGVEPNAEHVGGMNLFGRGFGDFAQDIVVRYAYR